MINFTKHTLANGLTLLHSKDESTPFVVVNVLYNVGAKHEDEDRTGFAHLFEHLMFEGTTNVANYDHPIQEAGGTNNAFTNNDFTNYYIKLPKDNIELALWLEADRMQNLDINENSLNTQKKVVVEEFKENYTNKPYGDVWHMLRALVYESHPYKWPTIGKDYNHINNATLEDVVGFYKKHYQPNNAILSICGNIEEEKALQYTNTLFGFDPSSSIEKKSLPVEASQKKPKFKEVKRNIPQDAIFVVFKMPERTSEEYFTADILTDILASGRSSRLKDKLIKEAKLFTKVDAYITGNIDMGMFVFEGKLKEGVTPKEGEQAIWEEIEKLKKEFVNTIELEKVKNKLLTYMAFSENELMHRAIGLCYHELIGNADGINTEEIKYLAVDQKAIQKFANTFFKKEKSSTLFYLKDTSAN